MIYYARNGMYNISNAATPYWPGGKAVKAVIFRISCRSMPSQLYSRRGGVDGCSSWVLKNRLIDNDHWSELKDTLGTYTLTRLARLIFFSQTSNRLLREVSAYHKYHLHTDYFDALCSVISPHPEVHIQWEPSGNTHVIEMPGFVLFAPDSKPD